MKQATQTKADRWRNIGNFRKSHTIKTINTFDTFSYIIFIGAAGLTIVAVIPFFFNGFFKANVSFGGTSLIIIASVILETLKQIESMMLVRNYKGFLND